MKINVIAITTKIKQKQKEMSLKIISLFYIVRRWINDKILIIFIFVTSPIVIFNNFAIVINSKKLFVIKVFVVLYRENV